MPKSKPNPPGAMTLSDRIFPPNSPHPGTLMQTQWIGTWESQFIGLGRLTAFLSDQLGRFSAADDDLGLGVVFLHRHRAEVGLKLLLERAEAPVHQLKGHPLDPLRNRCKDALVAKGLSSEWTRFCADQDDYLTLLDNMDQGGAVYRYPVDTQGTPFVREDFIDLAELEKVGAQFEAAVMLVVDVLARRAHPFLAPDQVEPTVHELAAAVRAIRSWLQFNEATGALVARMAPMLGMPSADRSSEADEAQSKLDVHANLLTRLQPSLLRVLDQLQPLRPTSAPPLDLQPSPLPTEPRIAPAALLVIANWIATETARHIRETKLTFIAIHKRSQPWTDPAGRQIHSDIGRLLSRL
jgi:hypothetical protein